MQKYLTIIVILLLLLVTFFSFWGKKQTSPIIDIKPNSSKPLSENYKLPITHCYNEGIEVDCKG